MNNVEWMHSAKSIGELTQTRSALRIHLFIVTPLIFLAPTTDASQDLRPQEKTPMLLLLLIVGLCYSLLNVLRRLHLLCICWNCSICYLSCCMLNTRREEERCRSQDGVVRERLRLLAKLSPRHVSISGDVDAAKQRHIEIHRYTNRKPQKNVESFVSPKHGRSCIRFQEN